MENILMLVHYLQMKMIIEAFKFGDNINVMLDRAQIEKVSVFKLY